MTAGNYFEWARMSSVQTGNLLRAATFDGVFLTELLPGPYLTMSIQLSRHANSAPQLISLWDCGGDDSRHHHHVPHYVSVQHSSSSPARDVGFNFVVWPVVAAWTPLPTSMFRGHVEPPCQWFGQQWIMSTHCDTCGDFLLLSLLTYPSRFLQKLCSSIEGEWVRNRQEVMFIKVPVLLLVI